VFARLLALGCLAFSALCSGQTDPVHPLEHTVVVYLRSGSGQPADSTEEMKREATALMSSAGYQLRWPDKSKDSGESNLVVVLELRGNCQIPDASALLPAVIAGARLASTAVVNGEVLPFSSVECETLSELLAPQLSQDSQADRNFLYGRAMGRVVAHELFHILTGEREHDHRGVAKASFDTNDLLSDRFEFEAVTLARLREASSESGVDSDGGGSVTTGR
jgi:hypothetical protein